MRRPMLAANFKLFKTPTEVETYLKALAPKVTQASERDIVICPPAVALERAVRAAERKLAIGAQDVFWEDEGAFTGATSAKTLRDIGVSHSIIGHSERRGIFYEQDEDVARKVAHAVAAGLTPIVCVGESLDTREAGNTKAWVLDQVDAVIKALEKEALNQIVIAYEPIWAIGTGLAATATDAQQVHEWIRLKLAESNHESAQRVRILYGGSVKPANIAELMAQPDIDGALVGGASLDPDSFAAIVNY